MEEIINDLDVVVVPRSELKKVSSDNNKNIKNTNSVNKNYKYIVAFLIILSAFIISFIYLGSSGYFKSEISQDLNIPLNNSVDVNNDYQFAPNTNVNNDYNMSFFPNYTINVYIDGSLINRS